MIGRTIEELRVGDTAELSRKIDAEAIRGFVEATGDDNPLHSDEGFAATTRFGEVIAPGIMTGGLLSAVIGTQLPGPGAIYLSQSFRFLRPVRVGEVITARVEVTEVLRDRNRVALRTVCVNQAGDPVIEGEAWVMPSKVHVAYEELQPARGWGLAYTPAGLTLQVMSFWTSSGLNFARRMLQLWEPRPLAPDSRRRGVRDPSEGGNGEGFRHPPNTQRINSPPFIDSSSPVM